MDLWSHGDVAREPPRGIRMVRAWKRWLGFRRLSEEEFRAQQEQILQRAPVPVFWLFGKTGSGKTSVVRFLTGAERAEIGTGFRPQTRQSQQYDFPSAESPVLRFLDTRGLGEGDYDPQEDLVRFGQATHVVVVTARVMDHALADVVQPLRRIRAEAPTRPVLLVLTCLHEAYPQQQHPAPDPFPEGLTPAGLPPDLRRSIERQQERFAGLVDRIVPVDFTTGEDGFENAEFGGERLTAALVEFLPAALRHTLLTLRDTMRSLKELNQRRAMPYVLGYSLMAGSVGAVPLPWVDIPAVLAIQSHLVYELGRLYGQPVRARMVLNMAGPIGGRLLARLLLRGPLKLIPWVGMAANAALTFAYTYGLGKACCWYFGELCQGNAPAPAELERVWQEQLQQAAALWKRHRKERAS